MDKSKMPGKRIRRTPYMYVDWWILETIMLLVISVSTSRAFHAMTTDSPAVIEFSVSFPYMSHFLPWLTVAVFIGYWITTLSDANEKKFTLVLLIASVVWYVDDFFSSATITQATHLIQIILLFIAYYYLRKAGECRELNFIRTAFGSKSSKSLIANVIFFELIAVCLGMTLFAITK